MTPVVRFDVKDGSAVIHAVVVHGAEEGHHEPPRQAGGDESARGAG
jgi:hypothetical protein